MITKIIIIIIGECIFQILLLKLKQRSLSFQQRKVILIDKSFNLKTVLFVV